MPTAIPICAPVESLCLSPADSVGSGDGDVVGSASELPGRLVPPALPPSLLPGRETAVAELSGPVVGGVAEEEEEMSVLDEVAEGSKLLDQLLVAMSYMNKSAEAGPSEP